MLWIKRNLFLVLGGLTALVLMGGSLFYLWQGLSRNRTVEEEYQAMKTELDRLYRKDPFPAQTNITTARTEVEKLEAAVDSAERFFQSLPVPQVRGLAFKSLLDNKIFQLTQKAEESSIELPDDPYQFSFAAQKEQLNLDPESFPGIVVQLVEVEAICNILFDARIHALTDLKRVRLTSDDPPGSKDYSDTLSLTTNQVTGAVLSPYEVSFTGFSTELAAVLEGFTRGHTGFLIEALKIERFEEKEEEEAPRPGQLIPIRRPQPVTPTAAPTENETVLNEERFLTSLLITVVRPIETEPTP